MWFLIYCDDDNSHSIIHDKYVMNVGGVKRNDKVSYFYRNKPYVGFVVDTSEDYDTLALELKKLGSIPLRVSTNVDKNSDRPTSSKRSSVPPVRFGESASSKRKIQTGPEPLSKEEIKKKKHIFELNKKTATLKDNKSLMGKVNKKDDDDDWTPDSNQNNTCSKDDSSDSDAELASYLVKRKQQRVELVKGIKRLGNDDNSKPETGSSPTKEDLKKQVEEMKIKLQLVYDGEEKNKSPPKSPPAQEDNLFDCEEKNKSRPKPLPAQDDNLFDLDESQQVSNDEKGSMDKSAHSEGSLGDADMGDGDVNDIDHDFELTKHQLFGKHSKDMILLADDIYCKATAVSKALCGGTAVSHVARRLIEGVFKEESLMKCTVSGQPYRVVAGHSTDVEGLNTKAVNAIIKYARATGKKRGWPKMKTSEIKTAMTQRLGEIKRRLKKKEQQK